MAQEIINYGASANDGTGDPLRTAFIKTDNNFDQIWAAGPVGSNITVLNNTISVINTNGNLVLSPNGTGIVQINRHLIPRVGATYDLGETSSRYRTVYANNIDTSGITKTGVFTSGTIPDAVTAGAGARAFVTDAASVSFGTAYVGGSTNSMPVFSDGLAWYIG